MSTTRKELPVNGEGNVGEKPKISRRRFLVLGTGAVGATVLACGGLAVLGTRQPVVEFIESSCGKKENTENRILIAYASQCGSTGGVAEAIGQVLCEAEAAVDVRLVKNVSDLSPYRAVVVGSAIHSSSWLPEVVEFVETHRDTLSQMPVAYFLVCMTMTRDTEETRRKVAAFLDPVHEQVPQVRPVDVGTFAGVLDFSKLPYIHRLVFPIVAGQATEGDFRDWEAIRTWAANVRPALLGT